MVTNPFFDHGTLVNKIIDKKTRRGGIDSLVFQTMWYTFYALDMKDTNGNLMGITHIEVSIDTPSSGIYTMRKNYAANNSTFDFNAINLIRESFPESYQSDATNFLTVYINRLYDSEDAAIRTKVNVYNYNDVITLTFDYPENTKHIGLRWDKSDWAKLENDNIFKLTHAYQTVGAKKQITFTGEQLLDVYGGLGKEIY